MGVKNYLKKYEIFADGKFVNVIFLGLSFTLIFTAFQTTSIIEQTVLDSVRIEDGGFTGNGYISLCIIYAFFGISTWLAPPIVSILTPKWSMMSAGLLYVAFIAGFLWPQTWLLYLTSVLIGLGAGILWTGQGVYLTESSSEATISRNSGVFWALLQLSLFVGNTFVFFQFHGKKVIDGSTRTSVFAVLTTIAASGLLLLFSLTNFKAGYRDKAEKEAQNTSSGSEVDLGSRSREDLVKEERMTPSTVVKVVWTAIKDSARLLVTPHMLLLSITCIYTGLELSFWSGVYPTAVGFTTKFGEDAKRLVGLIGILVGVGEVLAGGLFGIFGSRTTKKGRTPIIILGLLTHVTAVVLIYLNLPSKSPLHSTDEVSVINPPIPLVALLCAFLMGFGDACFQTQLISLFGSVYSSQSSSAFGLYRFTQALASAAAFYYSTVIGLPAQMGILLVGVVLGSGGFIWVELATRKIQKAKEDANGNSEKVEEGSNSRLEMNKPS